jgi:hypothetical protein
MSFQQIAIVGAGVAGLAAARALVAQGRHVTIYEKSRGPGGRAATRQLGNCRFDHGAQVFQAPDERFLVLLRQPPPAHALDTAPAQDLGRPVWTFDQAGTVSEGDPAHNAAPRWVWPGGMAALGHLLAAGLTIHYRTRVHALAARPQGGYTLLDAAGAVLGQADAVLLTPPAPQSAELVARSACDPETRTRLLAALAPAHYTRCLAVTLAYPRRPQVPWYALLNLDRQHAIAWLACEHDKPGHAPPDSGLLIAHMGDAFSVAHWDAAEKGTYGTAGAPLPPHLAAVHEQVQTLLPHDLGPPHWANLQRWRYALPDSAVDFEQLNTTGSGLYVAGDALVGRGRLHEAIETGWRVAEVIAHDS